MTSGRDPADRETLALMHPRHVCILGGTGFVGTHLCATLVRAGHRVTVLTRNPDRGKHLSVLPGLKLVAPT